MLIEDDPPANQAEIYAHISQLAGAYFWLDELSNEV